MKNIVQRALVFFAVLGTSVVAFAQEAAHSTGDKGMVMMASAIAISVAVLGGALGQGNAAAKALDGIARNPAAADKIQTPMIIALALIESLVLFAFVIAFVKIG